MDFTHPTNEVNLEYQNGNKYSIDKEGNLIYRKFENGDQEWYEGAKLIRKKICKWQREILLFRWYRNLPTD
jgi:hypothetical protein